MSRLLAFLKKKDGVVEGSEELAKSPPPSPKVLKTTENGGNKSVKQIKRRKRDKLKKKVSEMIMDDARHDAEEEKGIDANGNSMGHTITNSEMSEGGEEHEPKVTRDESIDEDSLHDVDSICDDTAMETSKILEDSLTNDAVSRQPTEDGTLDDAMDEAFEDLEEVPEANAISTRSSSRLSGVVLDEQEDEECRNGTMTDTTTAEGRGTWYSSCVEDYPASDCPESMPEDYCTASTGQELQNPQVIIAREDTVVDALNSALLLQGVEKDENSTVLHLTDVPDFAFTVDASGGSDELQSPVSPAALQKISYDEPGEAQFQIAAYDCENHPNRSDFTKNDRGVESVLLIDDNVSIVNRSDRSCNHSYSSQDLEHLNSDGCDTSASYPNDSNNQRTFSNSTDGDEVTPRKDSADTSAASSNTPSRSGGRKSSVRSLEKQFSVEDELSRCSDQQEAEARLAQRRAARAEAREMRLKELEKQQQQNPDNGEDVSDTSDGGGSGVAAVVQPASIRSRSGGVPPPPPPPPPPSHYSRRSSEDSNIDDTSKDVTEMQEKFREAMISNAQLDNEKTQLIYKVERLKDDRSDLTEQLNQLKKEHKKKCSDHEQLRKMFNKLTEENKMVRRVLEERDLLIQEYGLLVVGSNTDEGDEGEDDPEEEYACLMDREETEDGLVLPRQIPMKRVLLSQEASDILDRGAAKGSLEWRLRKVVEHKKEMEDELRRVNLQLEEHLSNQRHNNCLDSNIQREANKTVNEYKFKVQKAEAEVSSLQANVNRLEALVTRYKAQSEELEKSEEELKQEKRRLQRELRETQGQLEEMETSNSHLRKRFEKLKNARSNLLKDLSQDPVT